VRLEIFDVGHGACALLTAGSRRIMIDAGASAEFDFAPGDMLRSRGVTSIDLLMITNFDEDHARGLPNLLEKVHVERLLVNRGVQPEQIDKLKGYEPGDGIRAAIDMAKRYNDFSTQMTPIPDVTWTTYSHSYAKFQDENNLSLLVILRVGGVNFLFPGDMECDGMEALLDANPGLADQLKDIHVFVAPHHGRDSGLCDRVFDRHKCAPKLVVISDKGYVHDTQETVPCYRAKVIAGAGGWTVNGETRYVLTTRDHGTITFDIERDGQGGWYMGVN
jgi:beta-lactamase superfamily II metal-dependent hydrolase